MRGPCSVPANLFSMATCQLLLTVQVSGTTSISVTEPPSLHPPPPVTPPHRTVLHFMKFSRHHHHPGLQLLSPRDTTATPSSSTFLAHQSTANIHPVQAIHLIHRPLSAAPPVLQPHLRRNIAVRVDFFACFLVCFCVCLCFLQVFVRFSCKYRAAHAQAELRVCRQALNLPWSLRDGNSIDSSFEDSYMDGCTLVTTLRHMLAAHWG